MRLVAIALFFTWSWALPLYARGDSPKVAVAIEPQEDDKVLFLRRAPQTSAKEGKIQVSLRLAVTNLEQAALQLQQVEVTFTGPPEVAGKKIPTERKIGPMKTVFWNNTNQQNIILPDPPPALIHLLLHFENFADPVKVSKQLRVHASPPPLGSYAFPGWAADLRIGEYWTGSSGHAAGNLGSQLFAYDMGVIALDRESKTWSELLPGTNRTKNENWRIWGKPIRAMADGVILEAVDGVPNNPHALSWKTIEELDGKMAEQRVKYWGKHKNGSGGNHFYIQHGSEVVLYAHLQPGTLPEKLLRPSAEGGARVKAGEVLGLAGNSGNSTNPHLHIHAVKGTKPEVGPLRPLHFHGIQVAARAALQAPIADGPWVRVDGMGFPGVQTIIWPAASKPGSYEKK